MSTDGKTDPRLYEGSEHNHQVDQLLEAAQGGDLTEIMHLREEGFDLNATDYDLRSAAHLAATEGNEEVLRYFAEQGVNLCAKDRWGSTPIDDARKMGWDRLVDRMDMWINPPDMEYDGDAD